MQLYRRPKPRLQHRVIVSNARRMPSVLSGGHHLVVSDKSTGSASRTLLVVGVDLNGLTFLAPGTMATRGSWCNGWRNDRENNLSSAPLLRAGHIIVGNRRQLLPSFDHHGGRPADLRFEGRAMPRDVARRAQTWDEHQRIEVQPSRVACRHH